MNIANINDDEVLDYFGVFGITGDSGISRSQKPNWKRQS
jgi:hypothetical protein